MSQLKKIFDLEVNAFGEEGLVGKLKFPLSIKEIDILALEFPSEVTGRFRGELYSLKYLAKGYRDEILAYNIAYQRALNYEKDIDCKLNAA